MSRVARFLVLLALLVPAVLSEPRVTLAADGTISGKVIDQFGFGINAATVKGKPAPGSTGSFTFTATTGSDGNYRVPNVPPGTYELTGSPGSGGSFDPCRPTAVTVTVPDGGLAVPQDFVCNRHVGIVGGRFIEDQTGQPIAGVVVEVVKTFSTDRTITDTSNASGQFSLNNVPAGSVRLQITPPSDYEAPTTQPSPGVGKDQTISIGDIRLKRKVGTVSGRVVDSAGQPVAGANVVVTGTSIPAPAVTDGAGRYRIANVPTGLRTLQASKSGYDLGTANVTAVHNVEVNAPDIVLRTLGGTLSGFVTNAANGAALAGARVALSGGGTSFGNVITGAGGAFTFTNLPQNTYTLVVSRTGFVTQRRSAFVQAGRTTNEAIALQPLGTGDRIRFILTWGSQPKDLDSHLTGPHASGTGRFHVYYASKKPVPYAHLDVDDTNQFGPETITIERNPATGRFVPGVYRYTVVNFSRTPEFNVSGAEVIAYKGNRQIGFFTVAQASGNPALDGWGVVNFSLDENGTITGVSRVQRFGNPNFRSLRSAKSGDKR